MAIYRPSKGGDGVLCMIGCILVFGMLMMMMMDGVDGYKGGITKDYDKMGAIVSVTDGNGKPHKCHAILIVNMSLILGRSNCVKTGRTVVAGERLSQSIQNKATAKKTTISRVVEHCEGKVSLGFLASDLKGKGDMEIDFFIPHWIPDKKTSGEGVMLSWGMLDEGRGSDGRSMQYVDLKFKKCEDTNVNDKVGKTKFPTCAEHKLPETMLTFGDDAGAIILMTVKGYRPNPVGFLIDQTEMGVGGEKKVNQLYEDASKYACWAINFLWEPTSCNGGAIGKCNAGLAGGQKGVAPTTTSPPFNLHLLFWIQITIFGILHQYYYCVVQI